MPSVRLLKLPFIFSVLVISFCAFAKNTENSTNDSYLWLEALNGEMVAEWVNHQNKNALEFITSLPQFDNSLKKNLVITQSDERIANVTQRGDYLYNFWQDENHVRGIYRRTTLEEYRKHKPKWETVIDFDLLAKTENENWFFDSMTCLSDMPWMCLVSISRGGSDAVVTREINLNTKQFVEDGFFLPEGKSYAQWADKNTIYASLDIREGDLTESGYPAVIYTIKRGQDLNKAEVLFRTQSSSVGSWIGQVGDTRKRYHSIYEGLTFYENNEFIINDNKLIKVVKPQTAEIRGIHKNLLFVQLKQDWTYNSRTYPSSAMIYASMESVLNSNPKYQILAQNSKNKILKSISFTQSDILLNWMVDVKSELESVSIDPSSDSKVEITVKKINLPKNGSITIEDSTYTSDDVFITYESFLKPTTLYLLDNQSLELTLLKRLPEFFNSENLISQQRFATSKDGTKVPYFVIHNKDIKLDGSNPTILYSYGGYEESITPYYSPTMGSNWLEQGGVYVIGNIRGGGEYGPQWHQAALKTNRHKAFEDFEAIAEDLIENKITSPEHLGIIGTSNGGLLVGAALTRRPKLFKAAVSLVPLLDMLRFHKLLAGASWKAEYGDPDIPEERDYLVSYSPYHNLKKGISYPNVLIISSAKDDRVHPAHGRKMTAKMNEMGLDVLYIENEDGGHSIGTNRRQRAHLASLYYTFFREQLK